MTARFQMEPVAGGYEIVVDDQPGLPVPAGAQASRIYERWRALHDANDPCANTWLEGIAEGFRFKIALTGEPAASRDIAAPDFDDEYEAERIRQLQENRQSAAEQNVDLDERFGPGSFGCHEAMHLARVLAGLIERELCTQSAVLRDPRWYACARRASDNLAQLSFAMGSEHL